MARNNNNSDLKAINQDHEWLCTQNLGQFMGEWIAVYDRAVIAHDHDLKNLMAKVRAINPSRKPLLVQIPDKPLVVNI